MNRSSGILGIACALAFVSPAPRVGAGRVAPDCTLRSVDDTRSYDLRRFEGKVLWVDFWASWCGTCAEALPFLNDLDHDFRARGLQVVGINLDEDPREAQAFLARYPVSFEQAADAQGDCPRSFGVEVMPSSYLIDRRGVIREVYEGFRPGDAAQLRAVVSRLLAEEPGEPDGPASGGDPDVHAKDP